VACDCGDVVMIFLVVVVILLMAVPAGVLYVVINTKYCRAIRGEETPE
jgi:hypothetical protein